VFFFFGCVDCLVVYWYRVVEIQESVEDARQAVVGDEVSRAVDVAVGPSFRGAWAFFFRRLAFSVSLTCFSHRSKDHGRIGHHTQCVAGPLFCAFPCPPPFFA
jgi:hypothetical protein